MQRDQYRVDRVYNFIVAYKMANDGATPTLQEIADGVGLSSKSNVLLHMQTLHEQGRIAISKNGDGRRIVRVAGGAWSIDKGVVFTPVPSPAKQVTYTFYRAAGSVAAQWGLTIKQHTALRKLFSDARSGDFADTESALFAVSNLIGGDGLIESRDINGFINYLAVDMGDKSVVTFLWDEG